MHKFIFTIITLCFLIVNNSDVANAEVSCLDCRNCSDSNVHSFCTGEFCYTKFVQGQVERGCAETEVCQKDDPFCTSCNGAYCNNKKFTFPTCYVDNERQKKCAGFCYYYSKDNYTNRGCLADLEEMNEVRKECENNKSPYCRKCFADECNKLPLLRCIQCDENDVECTTLVAEELINKTALCNFNQNRCFVSYDDANRNKRGCTFANACENETQKMSCCATNDCNNEALPKTRHQCFKNADKSKTKFCSNPKDNCYVQQLKGQLIRGCVSDENNSCKNESDSCSVCTENKCNNQISCKTCNKVLAAECESKLCPSDTCISLIKDEKMEHRCANKDENKCGSETECNLCETSDCNADFRPKTWMKCHKCTGKECLDDRKEDQALYCDKYVKNDECYTKVENRIISRGCVSDLKNSENCSTNITADALRRAEYNDTICTICNQQACNSQVVKLKPLKCVQCDFKDPNCGPKLNQSLVAQDCQKPMPDGSPDKCYTYKNEVKRGCLADLTEDKRCASGETCYICDTNGCNNQDTNSAQTIFGINTFLYLLPTVIAISICY